MAEGVEIIQDFKPSDVDLEYTGIKVIDLKAAATFSESTNDYEACVVALTGQIDVSDGSDKYEGLGTRDSVFEKVPTDSIYISKAHEIVITDREMHVLSFVIHLVNRNVQHNLFKAENAVEDRGKYSNKRHVHNILPDSHTASEKLLVVEVYTDQGNWSSYPPHKHDVDNLPHESFLEEIYYHEMDPPQGLSFNVFIQTINL